MDTANTTPRDLLTAALGGGRKKVDAADQLEAIRALQARLTEAEHQVVFEERLHGVSWKSIARLTGMASKQAAQYRYQHSAGLVDRLAEATKAARGSAPARRRPRPTTS